METLIVLPFLCTFFYMVYLRHRYTWDMPLTPNPQLGRTIPMVLNYNRIVYVTVAEQSKLFCAYVFVGVGGTVIALYVFIRGYFNRSRHE